MVHQEAAGCSQQWLLEGHPHSVIAAATVAAKVPFAVFAAGLGRDYLETLVYQLHVVADVSAKLCWPLLSRRASDAIWSLKTHGQVALGQMPRNSAAQVASVTTPPVSCAPWPRTPLALMMTAGWLARAAGMVTAPALALQQTVHRQQTAALWDPPKTIG